MKILKNEPIPSRSNKIPGSIEVLVESMEINDCAEFDTEQEAQSFYYGALSVIKRKGKDYAVVLRKKRKRVWKVAKEDFTDEDDASCMR